MSRSSAPSRAQQETLIEYLEAKPWLATGHARTTNGRERSKAAWKEAATKLNSDGRGCLKTGPQWAKYWKDKKSATKKKYSQIRLARQRTGGGAAEEIILSSFEERIIALMGGEQFAVGDRELEIYPFHQANQTEPVPAVPAEQAQTEIQLNNLDLGADSCATTVSENLENYIQSMAVEPGTAECSFVVENIIEDRPSTSDPQPGPSSRNDENVLQHNISPILGRQLTQETPAPAPSAPRATSAHAPYAHSATSSQRRRRLVGRQRVLRRSPPSQRRSQVASLTERFLAIEERRTETEHMLAQNQREFINILQEMSRAWSRQSQALQDLANTFRGRP